MATIIKVPALGIAIANITITSWLVKEGEGVTQGQTLLEVQTDKISMEIPSESSGLLLRRFFEQGAKLKEGIPLAIIGETGENIDDLVSQVHAQLTQQGFGLPQESATATAVEPTPSGKAVATPLAKRVAKEKGVDLARVRGSGPGGRITEQDVLKYAEQQEPTRAATPSADVEYEVIPLERARKVIADHMVESVHISPHYNISIEVDCSRLVALRNKLTDEFQAQGIKLTYVPFMVKAVAFAVREVPIVNSTVRDGNIVVQKTAHIGIAVATGDLILIPVIRQPIRKTILEVAREAAHFIELVRQGGLVPQDVAGGTITITNMGAAEANVTGGTAIINQPQVAIVTMQKMMDRVVAVNNAIMIRPMMNVNFTFDHRVVMGIPGARFANFVQHYLEEPECLV